ncbi:MAG: hypothetical protein ACXWID_18080 [Pyrinomonadaceae bacterium]
MHHWLVYLQQLPPEESRSLWNAAKKVVWWDGASFVVLLAIALGLLPMKKFWAARIFFTASALALGVKFISAADDYLPSELIVHGKWVGGITAFLFLVGMLYWVATESGKLKPKTAMVTQLPIASPELTSDLIKQIEEKYGYELKKLEPHFVDRGHEYVEAYNDERGVIIIGPNRNGVTFHSLARSFGNEHPRNKVKSVKNVSFRLNFICYDRETRQKPQSVNIDRGAWMNEDAIEIDLPAHCPPRRAIVATAEGDNNCVYAVRRDSDSSYKGIHPLREELTGNIYTVFLTLLVESRNSKSFQYVLEITREPVVDLRLNDALFWKGHHLHNFIDESFDLYGKVHEIWEDAQKQFPLPPVQPAPALFPNILAAALDTKPNEPPAVDFFEVIRQRDAMQRAGEETLIEALQDWQARVAAFVDLWIGKEQSDKFVNCVPTFEDGLNCKPKGSILSRFTRPGTQPQFEGERWSLAHAVMRRRDLLMEFVKSLK